MTVQNPIKVDPAGLLLVNKSKGCSSFSLVRKLRRILNVRKIGHAGTLDPFATGLMVMLIGRDYTRLSDTFLNDDKEYLAEVKLGVATDSYDCDGQVTQESDSEISRQQIDDAIQNYQGLIKQIPPMFSALKKNGKRLYELARQGIEIEREPREVQVDIQIVSFSYPVLILRVNCSKGTYIRSLAHDLGQDLGCGAHLTNLCRLRSGSFSLDKAISEEDLDKIPRDELERQLIQAEMLQQ